MDYQLLLPYPSQECSPGALVMGYSIRTAKWRYTVWLKLGGRRATGNDKSSDKFKFTKDEETKFKIATLEWDWSWPPLAHELYEEVPNTNFLLPTAALDVGGPEVPVAVVAVELEVPQPWRRRGVVEGTGAFDFVEGKSKAEDHREVCVGLFGMLREALKH